MIPVNLIVLCFISQGQYGNYPTYLLANYMDEKHVYTIAQSTAEQWPTDKPGKKISKKSCKLVYDYDTMSAGKRYMNPKGGKNEK